uniref:C2H2-type domain-containing protein n=1 Tax=Sander lucioperca TaxID=283035 RepID=A0A8C9XGH5_SANLU
MFTLVIKAVVSLVSAALWEIVKQGAVMYYGLLEEFVTSVLETVPELLTYTERVQLAMGLRGCSCLISITLCVMCIYSCALLFAFSKTSSSEVKASVTNFLKLVQTLVDDQCQRDTFYQKIFPTVFGPKYDSALLALMRKFLFNLQKLLPVPNLEQTSLWLSLSPSILKECVDFLNQPEPLNTLIQHHKHHGHKVPQGSIFTQLPIVYHIIPSVLVTENNLCFVIFFSSNCETHQEGKCRVSHQHSQDNSSGNANKRNQENSVVSSGITQIPTTRDASANSQAKSTLTCQECGQAFTYYKSFEKHQSRCSKRAPRRKKPTNANHCVINACNFRSADNSDGRHAEASSETKESETAKTLTSAEHADDSQTESRAIKCTMCEKNFSEIVLMKRHYSKSHKVRGSYPCPLCKRTFVRLCELVRHQQNKRLYQCAACKKCYTKPGLLNDHEKVHSASVAPHICETCGKSFKSLAHLILHQSKHRERQPSVCSYCGKQFSTKDCLRAHMVRHTGGYPCPVCGKKFYQKTYLKWHLYKHTGQEPYLCDTCGKGWPSAAQLKLHMIEHTEERPFKCEDCGACYKRGSHLMAHRRAKHIRLRPFVCEVCSKAFRLNGELKKHMMVHTGERPFTCPRCDKRFTRNSRLREHREKACL